MGKASLVGHLVARTHLVEDAHRRELRRAIAINQHGKPIFEDSLLVFYHICFVDYLLLRKYTKYIAKI
jgi:hypothetical protein